MNIQLLNQDICEEQKELRDNQPSQRSETNEVLINYQEQDTKRNPSDEERSIKTISQGNRKDDEGEHT